MKIAVNPDPDQIAELLASEESGPVVMLNLLKFKDTADDGSGTGVEAYARYAERMRAIVESGGGRFLWSGRIDSQVLGDSDVDFDVAALVEYPSRSAFVTIASSPEVQEIAEHRAAGLEGQWLLACTAAAVSGAGTPS